MLLLIAAISFVKIALLPISHLKPTTSHLHVVFKMAARPRLINFFPSTNFSTQIQLQNCKNLKHISFFKKIQGTSTARKMTAQDCGIVKMANATNASKSIAKNVQISPTRDNALKVRSKNS